MQLASSSHSGFKKYIALNTDKHREATYEFDKDLYKFMNKSVFGKTVENVKKYIGMELVNDISELVKLTKRNEFTKARVVTPDSVSVHCQLKEEGETLQANLRRVCHANVTLTARSGQDQKGENAGNPILPNSLVFVQKMHNTLSAHTQSRKII